LILVIGGEGSGKRTYVRSLGYANADMADAVLDERPVVINLQELVRSRPDQAVALLPELCKKDVVICNEVGSGVIPVDQQERTAREQTGRLCILLAQKAERVVRLVCGVPLVIKG
jgi:adenosyl cobinamide kinase/adenosyl cobinamide phosphate guanylyltransferase